MPYRFYLPSLPDQGTTLLEGLEAHHLMHVLRVGRGDVVELFNGSGRVASAEVQTISKRDVTLQIVAARVEPPPSRDVVLGTAAPKGDRFDWLVEKATELGVTRLVPLVTARSVVDPRDSKLDKLRQTVVAACKQSGRNHLLELSPVMPWRDFVTSELAGRASFIAHPGPSAASMASLEPGGRSVAFAIGPEGGFTDAEVALAVESGAQPVTLGANILRIETAALVLAAWAAINNSVPDSLNTGTRI